MARNTRTRHQREKDLAELARLEADGLSHQQLAAKFKITRQQVEYDLKVLDDRFKSEQLANTARRKRRRHAELDQVKRKAREAFEKSRQDAEELHAETTKGRATKDGDPLPDLVKTSKTVKGQAGDAAMLEKELKAIIEQIRLWGDYPADKHEHTGPGGSAIPILQVEAVKPADAGSQEPDRVDA